MSGPESVDDIQRIKTCIISNDPRDDLKSLCIHVHHQLLLAGNAHCMLLEALGKLHLSSASTCHHCVGLETTTHDHYGIVERTLGLFDELLCTTTQDNGS